MQLSTFSGSEVMARRNFMKKPVFRPKKWSLDWCIENATFISTPEILKKSGIYLEFFCGRSLAHVTLGPENLS